MAVEKFVALKVKSSSIIDTLTHVLIAQGFSLVDLDRKKGLISGTVTAQNFLQNTLILIYPIPEGSLLHIVCTARPETSASGMEPGTFEVGKEFEQPCRKSLETTLDQIDEWREVSREWAEAQGIQEESLQISRQSPQARPLRMGLWGGLTVMIVGSLLAYLTLSDRVKLASPQIWIMMAVIGVFIFCFSLFSLVWRR